MSNEPMSKKKAEPTQHPDLVKYFQTVNAELNAVKDRIRSLIKHWPTDGAHKEAALRSVLRRHLPASLEIARGFVVGAQGSSSEIDLLIIDKNCPTLFRDESMVIVSPHFVKAIIEVKTKLVGNKKIAEAIGKLAKNKFVCRSGPVHQAWAGLFVYDGNHAAHESILELLGEDRNENQASINAVAFGSNLLIRKGFGMLGDMEDPGSYWVSWKTPGLAASYFIASMLDDLELLPYADKRMWFPNHQDNEALKYLRFDRAQAEAMPELPPPDPKA